MVRANIQSLSTDMLRGFERRLNSPPIMLRALAQRMTLKDAKTDQITNFIPMVYSDNSADRDLDFIFAKNYNEEDMDRNEYNLTYSEYTRDPSKIGGQAIFDQDYRAGMRGAAIIQEQISYKLFDTILSKATTSPAVALKAITATDYDESLEGLLRFNAHNLRAKLRLGMDTTIKTIVPVDVFPLLAHYMQKRETPLGDSAYNGMIFDKINNIRYMGDVSSPIEFTLAVTFANNKVGDIINFVHGSNHSTIKLIADDTSTVPKPGEVKLGADAAGLLANIVGFLTNQDISGAEKTGTSKYGARTQYDFNSNDPDARNLQRQEVRFVKRTGAGDLTMYGSNGRIELKVKTSAGVAKTNSVAVSAVKGKVLYVADGAMARYKVFDDMVYNSTRREKNQTILNHQISGTYGTFVTFGEAARFSASDITYASALQTTLGRTGG